MAKSKKRAAKKSSSPVATKATTTKAKSFNRAVPSGVADNIRAFLKQAGGPVTLAKLNEGLGKTHSAASVYSALQYMGRRREIVRSGRGATATYSVKAAAAAHASPSPKKRRGRKAKKTAAPSVSTAGNFASMIAELRRVAEGAEKAIVQRAISSTDQSMRALAEIAADLRARAANFLGK
jgi:hypothetical protein